MAVQTWWKGVEWHTFPKGRTMREIKLISVRSDRDKTQSIELAGRLATCEQDTVR